MDLESSDAGNMLDAYVVAKFMGREQKSPIKYATREPEWFHTFRFPANLPQATDPYNNFRPPDLAKGELPFSAVVENEQKRIDEMDDDDEEKEEAQELLKERHSDLLG